jgi:hypothetical protein
MIALLGRFSHSSPYVERLVGLIEYSDIQRTADCVQVLTMISLSE